MSQIDGSAPEGGNIVIRVSDQTTHDSQDLLEVAEHHNYAQLKAFLEAQPPPRIIAERVIRHRSPRELRERENRFGSSPFAPLHSLTAYWRLAIEQGQDREFIRRSLQGMPEIELAYHETLVRQPSGGLVGSVNANPYQGEQNYLDAGPVGIGARPAWLVPGCDGSGIKVIDLEGSWILSHQDLPGPQLLFGDDGDSHAWIDADHGAAVMGIVGAMNNHMGIVGVAPNLSRLDAASHYDAKKATPLHVAAAIDAAIDHLDAGDILLLEVQRLELNSQQGLPTEIDPADLDAIRQAVAHDIIVIEAAGNGGLNLDNWPGTQGVKVLNPQAKGFINSGAIMVGSARPEVVQDTNGVVGHERLYTSNYGMRIDVFAWGRNICTAGYGDFVGTSGSADAYTRSFGATSGASAIIAGAAALVQSWHRCSNPSPLTPSVMRSLMSDPKTGTPQAFMNYDPIGVMPDLSLVVKAP